MSRGAEPGTLGRATEDAPPPTELPPGLPRAVEVPLAIGLILVTAPLLAIAALGVVATSRGPMLFRQTRVGLHGRPFELLKLRTMSHEAGGQLLTTERDPRVTTWGRVLRWTKLDELPQLWNVLTGEMALVGPRPEVPKFVDLASPHWRRVLAARPGITDPVSIRLRDEARWIAALGGDAETAYRQRLLPWKLDGYLAYLERRSAWRDLGVLWQTLLAVAFRTGEEISAAGLAEPASEQSGNDIASDPHEKA